jgi:copper oxidase (laccase) domain-containing protein
MTTNTDEPTTLTVSLPGTDAPKAVMSLAAAGDMGFGDDGNRGRRNQWLRTEGFDPDHSAAIDLVHSRIVIEANRLQDIFTPGGIRREADGMVTRGRAYAVPATPQDGLSVHNLVITVADCMPIFLFDQGSGAYGLLHSGWKGTGILSEAVAMMQRLYGTKPADLAVAFGPRIGTCCYVVDEARAAVFSGEFGAAAVVRTEGQPRLDLVAANMALADSLGLGSVRLLDGCTSCNHSFGSFRRQGAGSFTRMAVAIGYPVEPV